MEWMPIETAPNAEDVFLRDVKECLVFGPEIGVKIGRAWRYQSGDVHADAQGFFGDWLITHWMPLPQRPTDRRTPEVE